MSTFLEGAITYAFRTRGKLYIFIIRHSCKTFMKLRIVIHIPMIRMIRIHKRQSFVEICDTGVGRDNDSDVFVGGWGGKILHLG